jgi:metal-responsive CopG/Arc/MetJ family transcriptional regulator
VVIEFPASLLEATDAAATDLDINRSDVIRAAVKRYLEEIQRKKLERELEEGYIANAGVARAIANDMMESESGLG